MRGELLDRLLLQVIGEARSLSIPVSRRIHPHVEVNGRARTRFGCCRRENGRYVIQVSSLLLEAEEAALRQVLAHEVLHTCPGCANHGAQWKHWAALMSEAFGYRIRRSDSHADLGVPDDRPVRYLVVCSQCGARIPRMKRSSLVTQPQRYRCKCGGSFYVLEKNDQSL